MGAPAMASLAAMRAGAGYVTACVPASLQQILDVQLLEVMTRGSGRRGRRAHACGTADCQGLTCSRRLRWHLARGSGATTRVRASRASWLVK